MRGSGVRRGGTQVQRSFRNTSYIICSFINLANLASCSRVLCTGSDTAQIKKA